MSKTNRTKFQTAEEILSFICLNPSATRQEIANALGLQPPTVRRNVFSLLQQGRIRDGLTASIEAMREDDRYYGAVQ